MSCEITLTGKNSFSMEKKGDLFGKCYILKYSFSQFELIRSYKIIFGKWHLSIDEIYFSSSQIQSWWVLSGGSAFCSAGNRSLAWANSAIYGSLPEADRPKTLYTLASRRMFGALSKDSKEEIIFFRTIVDGGREVQLSSKKWVVHPLAAVLMAEWQCGPILGPFALIAGCVRQCVFEVCNLIDMQATAYPVPSC